MSCCPQISNYCTNAAHASQVMVLTKTQISKVTQVRFKKQTFNIPHTSRLCIIQLYWVGDVVKKKKNSKKIWLFFFLPLLAARSALEHPYSGHFHLSAKLWSSLRAQPLNRFQWNLGGRTNISGNHVLSNMGPRALAMAEQWPFKVVKKSKKIEKSKLRVLCVIYLTPFVRSCSPNKKYL